MVDLEAIRKVSYSCPSFVCVGYDYNLVSSIDELRGELVNMTFDSSGLREEEVADHGDIIRHGDGDGYANQLVSSEILNS
jgi:hypothetical protein